MLIYLTTTTTRSQTKNLSTATEGEKEPGQSKQKNQAKQTEELRIDTDHGVVMKHMENGVRITRNVKKSSKENLLDALTKTIE